MTNKEFTLTLQQPDSTFSDEQLEAYCVHPEEFLKVLSQTDKGLLSAYLVDKLSDKDGGPEVSQYKVEKYHWDKASQQGELRLSFLIQRRFCCSEVEAAAWDYIDLKLSKHESKLTLRGSFFDWVLDN